MSNTKFFLQCTKIQRNHICLFFCRMLMLPLCPGWTWKDVLRVFRRRLHSSRESMKRFVQIYIYIYSPDFQWPLIYVSVTKNIGYNVHSFPNGWELSARSLSQPPRAPHPILYIQHIHWPLTGRPLKSRSLDVLSTFYLTCKDEMVTCACVCVSAGPDSEGAV